MSTLPNIKKRKKFQKLTLTYSEKDRLSFIDSFHKNKKKKKKSDKKTKQKNLKNEKRKRQDQKRKEASEKIDKLKESYRQ
ncbi:hypothetical protein M153_2200049167 [Pseudoloma neurophilia]|uniref:Uncharacterized protein n=1 Tax=Pseudoloma neurophilia TaxID=146866 RepID=A0A0R0MA95_9MICR|nr:hypothetical protein M153_2200049167 [Pseudoloma neurophilia]